MQARVPTTYLILALVGRLADSWKSSENSWLGTVDVGVMTSDMYIFLLTDLETD